ncbi:MAG: MotA/TolQ/ExbB proton channel family protein [bacterium]|nr:MotA/TolQ/ExbB proton channel family protein [bacterium]
MQFFQASGVVGIPLAVLTLVIAGLILRAVPAVRRGDGSGAIFAILFWGFVAAVLGFLGQCAGLYNALTVIATATAINPSIVSQGFAQSFTTTLWGSGLLLVAGLAWFVLRTWNDRAAGART